MVQQAILRAEMRITGATGQPAPEVNLHNGSRGRCTRTLQGCLGMEGYRSELDGLLTEMLVTGSGGGLGDEDLSVLRRHGRMYRLLGLIPTALGSADEVTDAWKTLVELFLALRNRLVPSVSLWLRRGDKQKQLSHGSKSGSALRRRPEGCRVGQPSATSRLRVRGLWGRRVVTCACL